MRAWLRAIRAFSSFVVGGVLSAVPGLEPAFLISGRWLDRRSRLLGTLYWFGQEDLLRRLRRSGRQFRPLPVAGVPVAVDITDGTGRMHYFYEQPYEPALARAMVGALRPGDVFLDVGANVGFFSVLAARLVGETGRVVAFEPHPQAIARLRQAIAVNEASGTVEIVEAALGSAEGTVRLFLSDDSVLSTTDPARSPARDHFAFPRSLEVRLTTLDGWLAEHPGLAAGVRLIKIDVEGTEADVVEGMRSTLTDCRDAAIVCETAPGSPADLLLRHAGYEGSVLDARDGLFGNYLYEMPRARPPATRVGP